jgi:uncharacterized transporter YbjL
MEQILASVMLLLALLIFGVWLFFRVLRFVLETFFGREAAGVLLAAFILKKKP